MKIALIGSTGQLGTDIIRANNEDNFNYEIFELSHDKIEITNFENSYNILKEIAPDLVINTAAFHKVDDCEEDQEKAYKINTIGIRNIGIICNRIESSIMHISTDYVFDGKKKDKSKGYTEFDQPNPLNIYGCSKLEGEKILKTVTQEYYIVRTAWLFGKGGSESKGGNFVTTMLRLSESRKELKVVSDQVGSPTNTCFLASQLLELAKYPYYGTYHAVCQGMTCWYDYAKEIFRIAGKSIKIIPISSSEFRSKSDRPCFSALDNYMLTLQGLNKMPEWKMALNQYLKEIL